MIALPVPNQNGDYTNTRKGQGHINWQVVDPDPAGLNCRMAKQFQGFALDAMNTPDELMSRDYTPNVSSWEVIHQFPPGEKLWAITGNVTTQHIQFDDRGKPWLGVRVPYQGGNEIIDCFVRANRRFIKPI
ncbi:MULTISPECIES: hypothetical protein [Leptolyngbya]|uniref:hypothetical protein n=1 Tax=Leptolyngbya TaxID=47251 RepID=UPI00037E3709|nr:MULTISPECIES: hypothetical protein [Leptolyngbya]MBD2371595.1 hypothetical protein [Leptolyngbya sp. FACHB-161]MBD2378154.1 hypothetical protein [Leptolyngbya sp. FACHB-238]MBD2402558.1 hypothetical protein [Leptolyngbya sp. FACHB-239]MBD2409083.1 hypothetical protein [Leptolyngbya sp. FACHB-402]ULP32573.1 hypothetical protein MCP04_12550 [Leptolyngbya boryana IU 594]